MPPATPPYSVASRRAASSKPIPRPPHPTPSSPNTHLIRADNHGQVGAAHQRQLHLSAGDDLGCIWGSAPQPLLHRLHPEHVHVPWEGALQGWRVKGEWVKGEWACVYEGRLGMQARQTPSSPLLYGAKIANTSPIYPATPTLA